MKRESHRMQRQERMQGAAPRRGTVLILVIGVLVLLAVSAAAYIGVGKLDRVASQAFTTQVTKEEVAAKVFDYIGTVLTQDLLAADPMRPDDPVTRPFLDGERWDYPYTRITSGADDELFNVQADAWLASLEPVDTDNDGVPDTWPHISNIHPQGDFVDLGQLFNSNRGFFGDLNIPGASPWELDTPLLVNSPESPRFGVPMDEINGLSQGYVTMADRRYVADADGDGRPDSRWTELTDVYGLPGGMRVFAAARIIDLSGMLNVNAHYELGLTADNSLSEDTAGDGANPADVDLYSFLVEEYERQGRALAPPQLEARFIDGEGDQTGGFRWMLNELGLGQVVADYQTFQYRWDLRLDREERQELYNRVGRFGSDRAVYEMRPFGIDDELELRTFAGVSNDRATSRLEQIFDSLNVDPRDEQTSWFSPLRNRWFNEVDYTLTSQADFNFWSVELVEEARHQLTTINGSRSVRPWNRADFLDPQSGQVETTEHGVLDRFNINALAGISPASMVPNVQDMAGGFFWALAPYAAINRRTVDSQDVNVLGSTAQWGDLGSGLPGAEYHYGEGSAGYSLLLSSMLAVNARDFADSDTDDGTDPEDDWGPSPTTRFVFFQNNPDLTSSEYSTLDPLGNGITDVIAAPFDHGFLPESQLIEAQEDTFEAGVIGVDQQPFFREVATLLIYHDSDLNDGETEIRPTWPVFDSDANPSDLYLELVAFELGNPWSEPIRLDAYEIRYGLQTFGNGVFNQWMHTWDLEQTLPNGTLLDPGERIILYAASNPTPLGSGTGGDPAIAEWLEMLKQMRNGGETTKIYRINATTPEAMDLEIGLPVRNLNPIDWTTATLWHKKPNFLADDQLAEPISVMVDRIRPFYASAVTDPFPNVLTDPVDYGPEDFEGAFHIRTSSIRRYCAKGIRFNPETGVDEFVGFPGYLFQSPVDIGEFGSDSKDDTLDTPGNVEYPPAFLLTLNNNNDLADYLNDLGPDRDGVVGQDPIYDDDKGYLDDATFSSIAERYFAPYQLYQQDPSRKSEGFVSTTDLMLVTAASGFKIVNPDDSGRYADLIAFWNEPLSYVTVTEYLGDAYLGNQTVNGVTYTRGLPFVYEAILGVDPGLYQAWLDRIIRPGDLNPAFRTVDAGGTFYGNPHVGLLNYLRYIPRLNDRPLGDLAIPLATRVLEAFETMPIDNALPRINGRINVNTASLKVLRALPYLYARYDVYEDPSSPTQGTEIVPRGDADTPTPNDDMGLAESLIGYRDRDFSLIQPAAARMDWRDRSLESGLAANPGSGEDDGLRDDGIWDDAGFISPGELALVNRWTWERPEGPRGAFHPPLAPNDPRASARDLADARQSLARMGHDGLGVEFFPLDPTPEMTDDTDVSGLKLPDSIAERLALTRAIRNSTDVRSDVFAVYVSLVGVTEADLRQAQAQAQKVFSTSNPSMEQMLESLRPSVDQRFIVVMDRSNVSELGDRPRMIFGIRQAPQP